MIEVKGRLFWFLQLTIEVPTVADAIFLWTLLVASDLMPVGIGVYVLGQWLGGQL